MIIFRQLAESNKLRPIKKETEMEITSQTKEDQKAANNTSLDDIVATRSETEAKLADLENQVKDVRDQLKQQLTTERTTLLNKINKVVPEIEDLKKQHTADEAKLVELKKKVQDQTTVQYANVQKQFSNSQTELETIQKQQRDVQTSLNDYNQQTDAANKKLSGYQDEEAEMVDKIKQETDLTKMIELAERQKSHVQALNAKKADVKGQLDVIDVKISNAKGRLETLPKDEAAIKDKQSVLAEQIKSLKAQIKAKQDARDRERDATAKQLEKLQSDLTANQKRYDQYTKQLKETKQKLASYFNVQQSIQAVKLDKQRHYFALASDLTPDLASRYPDTLGQLKRSFDQIGATPTVVTTKYNDYLTKTWQQYKKSGLVSANSQLLNLYQSLQETEKPGTVKEDIIPQNADWQYVKDDATHSETVKNEDDQPVMQVKRRADNSLWYVLYYSQGKVIKRDVFDLKGQLSATQYLDQKNVNRVVSENFYRTNGSLVLVKEYNDDNKETIQLLNESGILLEVFSSENELIIWWLRNMVFTNGDNTVVIDLIDDFYTYLAENTPDNVTLLPVVTDYDKAQPALNTILTGRVTVTGLLTIDEKTYDQIVSDSQVSLRASSLPKLSRKKEQVTE
ncbi:hypothetical protein AYR54_11510 [Loigolactobacillus backii]|nr:hypothetical protein AYR52_11720 [Loigolactobacillus backii]ANK65963.1 hypothetical protein AYR54_11510 [Loigolactobacillus backii]